MAKKVTRLDKLDPKEDRVEEKSEKKKSRKKKQAEGSRWAAIIILALTLIAGLVSYGKSYSRQSSDSGITKEKKFSFSKDMFMSKYVIEK